MFCCYVLTLHCAFAGNCVTDDFFIIMIIVMILNFQNALLEEEEDVLPAGVPPPSDDHVKVLHNFFGHSSFRPMQWKIIHAVMQVMKWALQVIVMLIFKTIFTIIANYTHWQYSEVKKVKSLKDTKKGQADCKKQEACPLEGMDFSVMATPLPVVL